MDGYTFPTPVLPNVLDLAFPPAEAAPLLLLLPPSVVDGEP